MSSAEAIADAIAGLNATERDELRELWRKYLDNINDGEPQLVLPEKLGHKLGKAKLCEIATNYSFSIGVRVHIVHDSKLKAYLIGDGEELPPGVTGQTHIFATNDPAGMQDSQMEVSNADTSENEDMEDPVWSAAASANTSPFSVREGPFHFPLEESQRFMLASMGEGVVPMGDAGKSSKGDKAASMEVGSKSSKSKEVKLPKPSNSFILYRKFKQPTVLASNPDLHCSQVSKVIGEMWRSEDPRVKAEFQSKAEEQKKLFMEQNPDWKCSPRKSSDIRRRNSVHQTASRASIGAPHPNFHPNQGNQSIMTANPSFGPQSQFRGLQPGSQLFGHPNTTPTASDSYGPNRLHRANSNSVVNTLDKSKPASEKLPTLYPGDLPWSFGFDEDEPDYVDQNWMNSLASIDSRTPNRFLSRRNMFLAAFTEEDDAAATDPFA